jgi:hypothetical protein
VWRDWVHLVCRSLTVLSYPARTIDDEYGAVGGMRIGRGNQSTRRKPAHPVPLCPPQIPHDLTLGFNPDRRGGKLATNRLSYGTATSSNLYDLYSYNTNGQFMILWEMNFSLSWSNDFFFFEKRLGYTLKIICLQCLRVAASNLSPVAGLPSNNYEIKQWINTLGYLLGLKRKDRNRKLCTLLFTGIAAETLADYVIKGNLLMLRP